MDYFEDDERPSGAKEGVRFKEFDCPTCDANNPRDDGFNVGDEVTCHYCGVEFRVKDGSGRKPKLVEA